MSSIQFVNTYAEDERWLDAGADAFALHFAACCYADRRDNDGVIPKAMVPRLALAVAPERVAAAVAALLMTGFWVEEKTAYRIVNFVEDKIGLPAEEKLANRERWAADKRWRRKHNAGNHSECPPEKCRHSGVVSQPDIQGTPTKTPTKTSRKTPKGVPEDSSRTTRPDSLRLDSTRLDPKGEASESESEGLPSGPASAGAPASPRSAGGAAGKAGGPGGGVYLDPEIYGRNPTPMTPEQAARIDAMVARMEAEDDEANTLVGLIPAGGADG